MKSRSGKHSKENTGNKTTVPDCFDESESTAKSWISDAGLKCSVAYEFSDSTAEGKVIKQSVSGGSSVKKNSTVKITVSKGKRCPTTDWTDDASWKNSKWYTVDTKTQYRYQNVTKQTLTEYDVEVDSSRYDDLIDSGYTASNYRNKKTYGELIDNGTTPVQESDGIEVETTTNYVTDAEGNEVEEIHYAYREVTTTSVCDMTLVQDDTDAAWSQWTDTVKQRSEYTNRQTRTVYKYTEK